MISMDVVGLILFVAAMIAVVAGLFFVGQKATHNFFSKPKEVRWVVPAPPVVPKEEPEEEKPQT